MFRHVQLMIQLMDKGAITFDYGNNIRARAQEYQQRTLDSRLSTIDCFAFPGFVPAYIRPLFCEGKGPFRWAALSGDANDIAVTDEVIMNLFPQNAGLLRWMKMAKERIAFQGKSEKTLNILKFILIISFSPITFKGGWINHP